MGAVTILLVEDDHGLRDVVARGLREAGFTVVTAADGASALRSSAVTAVEAVVLDIGLPDSDGRDVCQAMRARGMHAPVLFLTARDTVTDRLSGFSVGGDDYLIKPFALAELVARLRSLLRRSGSEGVLTFRDLEVDPVAHAVRGPGGSGALSPTEFRLLARLVAAPEAVVRRRELIAVGWPDGAIVSDNTLDQYVTRLRRKLREIGSLRVISVARGVGYQLT